LKLWEASNDHHNAVAEYLDKHGVTDQFIRAIQGKAWFLNKIAKEHNIDLKDN
jgi:nucleotide-binding universal stress UspA family protein